jgi:hypothetical protein
VLGCKGENEWIIDGNINNIKDALGSFAMVETTVAAVGFDGSGVIAAGRFRLLVIGKNGMTREVKSKLREVESKLSTFCCFLYV